MTNTNTDANTPAQPSGRPGSGQGTVTTGRTGTVLARRPLTAWRTTDLVTAAMIGVTFGVAYLGWGYVYHAIDPVTKAFPPISGLLMGPWLLAGAVAGLVIRRPGAAVIAEVVAASVEPMLGGSWGVLTLVSGLLQGLGFEIAFAIFAYRKFGPTVLMLGGALAAALECVLFEWHAYYPDWAMGWKLAYLGAFAVSGVVIAGLGAHVLTKALARTGVVNAFPPGQEYLRARAR